MKAQQECQSGDTLARYLRAQLPDADAEAVEQHLAGCQICLDRVRGIEAGDSFFRAVQAVAGAQEYPSLDAGEFAALKEKVLALNAAATRSDCSEGSTSAPEGVPGAEPVPLDFLAPPQAPDEIGRLGPYRVLKVLGAGGMGMVFLAEDPQLGRPVALKVMLPARASSTTGRERFLREARAAAAVVHDHVVTIHQVGEDRGVPFLAMQLLDGESLQERLRRQGRLPLAEVLRIGCEVALGLAAAHKRGLIHRDIKPANLWLESEMETPATGGRVKILDFGLALTAHDDAHLTQEGFAVGTPAYMSPEQARGEEVDPRTDLFSLGCVLYLMATGQRSFPGKNLAAVLHSLATVEPTPPGQLNPDVSPGLDDLVMQLLEREPTDRPATALEVADRLQALRQQPTGFPSPETVSVAAASNKNPQRKQGGLARRRTARKRWLPAATTLLLLAIGGIFVYQIVLRTKGPDGNEADITDPGSSKGVTDNNGLPNTEFADPIHPLALVQQPARLKGLATWSIAPRNHPGGYSPIVYSPDGKWVYSAGMDGAARIYATETFSLGNVFLGHQGEIPSLAFSLDGKYLATAGADRTVRLWDPKIGKIVKTIPCAGFSVRSLAWSPNGKSLAGGTTAGTLCLWDVESNASPKTFHDCPGEWSVVWSPDGSRLAIGSGDKTVRICDAQSGKLLHAMHGHSNTVWRVAWSPTGKYLVSSSAGHDKKVRVWDADKGELLYTLDTDERSDGEIAAWSPDGTALALAGMNKIRFLNPVTAKVTRTITRIDNGFLWYLAWSPDGKTLLGSGQAGIGLWDVKSGQEKHVIPLSGGVGVMGVAWSPSGDRFVSLHLDAHGAAIWQAGTGQRFLTLGWKHRGRKQTVAWSPDERRVALGSSEVPEVQLWNSFTGKPLRNLAGHTGGILAVAWSPDGKLLASAGKDKTVWIWNMAKYEVRHTLKEKGTMNALAWSPDNKRVAAAGSDGTVHIWDAVTGKPGETISVPDGSEVRSLAWSPDDRFLASASGDVIHLWNPSSGQLEDSLKDSARRPGDILCLAWSPDGKNLASGGAWAHIQIWDSGTGRLLHDISDAQGNVLGLAWSPDGRSLLWGNYNGPVRLWDAQANQVRATFYTLLDNRYLTVNANGHYLGSRGIEDAIVYVAVMEDGRQETLTPAEFTKKYGWKNDPAKVKPLP